MNSDAKRPPTRLFPFLITSALVVTAFVQRERLIAWLSFEGDAENAPATAPDSHDPHLTHAPEVYTCPMDPGVRSPKPGNCPICGMTLTKVEAGGAGAVRLDAQSAARIGLQTQRVQTRALSLQIRAVGEVVYDETRMSDVNLRVSGWVQKLHVNKTGQPVGRGTPLLTLYSPEILAAQLELLAALRAPPPSDDGAGGSSPLARAAEERLRLLGMDDAAIEAVAARGTAEPTLTVRAERGGFVLEKDVVAGAKVEAGMRVYRVAALDRVWVEARVYEPDLPYVHVGQPVTVTAPELPGIAHEGTVAYVYPYVDPETRTGRVRIELPNEGLQWKPGLFIEATLRSELPAAVVVPESAVLYTGARRVVFVADGDALAPRELELGPRAEGHFVVRSGLHEGESVAVSGNFFLAAESRLKAAPAPAGSDHGSH